MCLWILKETFFLIWSLETVDLLYLSVEHGPLDGVKGSFGDEVVDVYGRGLPYAMCSVLCLFDVSWVPVEFGKDHVRCCCKCQTLRASGHMIQYYSNICMSSKNMKLLRLTCLRVLRGCVKNEEQCNGYEIVWNITDVFKVEVLRSCVNISVKYKWTVHCLQSYGVLRLCEVQCLR